MSVLTFTTLFISKYPRISNNYMTWVKLRIEVNGKDELMEFNYTTFKREMRMRKLHDRIILKEKGITREMPSQEFKNWLIEIISMMDIEDQKEIIDSVADMIFR